MLSVSEIEELNVEEYVRNHYKNGKSMNAFFLYRKEYTKRAIANGIKAKMTNISKAAGESWRNEKPKIKKAFAKVSKRIDELLQRRRQSEKTYQIIYDPNMERVQPISQESVDINNQHDPSIQNTPTLYFPSYFPLSQDYEYSYSLSVEDIAYLYWNSIDGPFFI
ncbi:10241_t:CDS:1 [Racocetra fulgida]|uniref:10241_t:CDS:1 n=1 Tax=Racocetra fulgida TaxID=60492 RepID=A0A9N9CPV5_9GLOM|nr:10241_t:CDS:1 [Racocetra fulgida]